MSEISVLKDTLELVEKGVNLALVTITRSQGSTPRITGAQMAVLENGSIIGTIGGGALEKKAIELTLESIEMSRSVSVNLPLEDEGMVCGGEVDIFIQVFNPRPELLIVGGGHVSLALYQMACLLNFDIVILEDREEFLTHERFPLAKKLILGPVDDGLREYDINENSYIIIVTRGHKHDGEALEAVINSKAKYIGVIGSRKKVLNMFNNLKEKGIDEEKLSSIYSPIGLDIADNTPGEIAVSILAEILAVKNSKTGLHMKLDIDNHKE
ncbi:MAG: XdhC/CoxI family protein [Tissierellaceae bacterium]